MREAIKKEKIIESLGILIKDLEELENNFIISNSSKSNKNLSEKEINKLNNLLTDFYKKYSYISSIQEIYKNYKLNSYYYTDDVYNLISFNNKQNKIIEAKDLYKRYYRNIIKSSREYYVCDLEDLKYFNIL